MFKYFDSEGHIGFLGEIFMTLIDKTDSKDTKTGEKYWITG